MATLQTDISVTRQWLDLTLAQRPVWLDASISSSPAAYLLVRWARLQGSVDIDMARQALALITARHDALRLRVDSELPRQWIHPSSDAPFSAIDLSSEANSDKALQAHCKQSLAAALPLGDNWLFSLELIKLGSTEYFLLARCHHLLADEVAVSMILAHWLGAYRALTSDTAVELAPPSSYQSVISSDAPYIESDRYKQDLDYWLARFKNLSPQLIDIRTPDEAAPATHQWQLEGELYSAFAAACANAGVPPHRATFALFNLVLARRYSQSDLTIGMALHRRDASNFHVVGMLSGMLPVRCQLAEGSTLLESIEDQNKQLDRDLRHQRLPVDALSRELGLRGGLSELFQVAFSFMPSERGPASIQLDGINVEVGGFPSLEASPITIHAHEMPEKRGILLDIAAHPGVVGDNEPALLLQLFQLYLRQFISDADLPIEALPIATPEERVQVVSGWNATAAVYPAGRAEAFFHKQALQNPDALAVLDTSESLTYAQLDSQSSQLARSLFALGLTSQSVVGVAMERSVSTVVSLLAILKAGCIYLPLDLSYPPDRLSHMLSDSGAKLVITNYAASFTSTLPKFFIDDPESWENHAASPIESSFSANETAYIIYTSGSTGKPKGVAVPHRAAVNLAFARLNHDPISTGHRVLAAISVGFDVSIGQLLLPLLSGATVVIAPDLRTLTSSEFWQFIQSNQVTHINSVPSFFESILEAAPQSTSLIRLMLGGEALSSTLVRRLRKQLPATQVFNMYGPTEACIDATAFEATGLDSAAVLPIGKPLPNYRAYVLNQYLEPVGVGMAGELYLAGAGLAHAYINQPGLTAERFIADPFGNPGDRLYKTGDRARWRSDGNIDFLGRADTQVKIRGHRIELGEIEASLLLHPSVAQASVIANNDKPGAARLVAYVVLHSPATPAQLRSHLATHVPEYMIPAALSILAALPLTPNGKLDHRALPPVKWQSERTYVAPETGTEKAVANIFSELLGTPQVGLSDSFFELGGHSLLAARLVSQLRSHFNLSLSLRAVFESPTVEAIASAIDAAAGHASPSFKALPRPEFLPLAFTQERLWFLSQLQSDDTYNVPIAVSVSGPLDIQKAVSAINEIVRRHESLRTCIVMQDGKPIQQLRGASSFQVETLELQNSQVIQHRLKDFARRPFHLATSLPIRAEIVSAAPNHYVIAAVVHHSAFDGWSASLFFHEFARIYSGESLPELRWQQADFAVWQRQQNFSSDLAYWKNLLAGAPPVLDLPTSSQYVGKSVGIVPIELDATLHDSLLRLANTHGASLFMLLHAAFAVLLARWSGQNDIVIGTVVANRTHAEFEPIIGCLVNTLALRTKIESRETFVHLLNKVRDLDLAAYEHQGLPFEKLVDELQPERSATQTPIFQVMLVLQNELLEEVQLPGLAVEPIPLEPTTPKFNLTLNLGYRKSTGCLTGSLEYASNLYDAQSMERFSQQFQRILHLIAQNPDRPALELDLLPPSELSKVTSEWNATDHAYPSGRVESFFQNRALQSPNALAVISATESLTYAELDIRSNRLAHVLLNRGAVPKSVVGVALHRSVSTVISILAILKAGCTYLPLDPAYPADRLAHMLADSGAQLVITSHAISELLPPAPDRIFIDNAEEGQSHWTAQAHSPHDPAYIIYTSGSTGKPKGVAVPHTAAVNLAFARLKHDPISQGDRILAAISVGFDVSIGQLLLPLLSGATVVIASDLRTLSPQEFWAFIESHQITHINSVPSFFESVLETAPKASSLFRLMLGGEPLSSALAKRLHKALPRTQVFNMYGPTEACIDATSYQATGQETQAFLPIGKPLPNYRAYILDSCLNPVGIGITGDLYLAGSGLAHCYINQPALTAERFIANHLGTDGERLYKTGDRARWLPDGNIEFLGRADSQVKIRGHRIELGEVESALLHHSGVQDAAVIVRADSLVAYYKSSEPLTANSLRAALSKSLPAYMLPAAYVSLDALPLTPNGKLDRKALPAPNAEAYPVREFEAPIGKAEQQIADIFAAVLNLRQVGRHDNFFEWGGHSLMAMTVIDRMRQSGLNIGVTHLFTSPTPAGLAAALSTSSSQISIPPNAIPQGASHITPEMLPLVSLSQSEIGIIAEATPGGATNIQDIYPLAPLQEGILFHHLISSKGDAYLTPFLFGFQTRESLDVFLGSLHELVTRHDILRTAILWEGLPEPLQVVLRSADLPVEQLNIMGVPDVPLHLRERFDPQHFRIDVRQAPMLRAYIAPDIANNRWLLLIMTHHLILDHTSMEITLQEAGLVSAGLLHTLPEPVPFRNFVAQTRLGVSRQEHESFFKNVLSDVQETTAPFGLLHVQGNGAGIRESTVTLPPVLAHSIRAKARSLGVTPASFFHLAWSLVLAHVSGRRDVVFGTLLLGRLQSGGNARRALGLFINTLPLRLQIDGTGVEASLHRTHQKLAELLRHENASLALAQRCSGVPAPAPLFSSLFNFRQSPPASGGKTVLPGVELVFARERTDYPVAIAVDDHTEVFSITAQADAPADPAHLCSYMETAVAHLLAALENTPALPLHRVGILPVLAQELWNNTAEHYPIASLPELFERQVSRTPHIIAVTGAAGSLTYLDLNEKAEKLANHLVACGVTAQSVVGVALPRSADTIVSFLAILKIGAIYLPLDPALPQDRLAHMIADSRAVFVISNTDSHPDAPPRPNLKVRPGHTAYIIYTSGSTGKPKGVAVPHSAAANLAFARQTHDPITIGSRVLAAISVGFDVSIGQLLLPLLSGATVVIASDLRTLTPREFWSFLEEHSVTHINSVPSFFESILDAVPNSNPLKRLMLGGEPLSSALVRRLRELLPATQVINMYGPTEACIDATCYITSGNEASAVLPIGKPLPNYQAYILNDLLDPVTIGVEGDLYLAGEGLAHGYINQPALTAERFIANPFGKPSQRLYKTGDRARWGADGNIEFLGRADTQVKIRGHRIELGEIESALLLHPSVVRCVVVSNQQSRLVAYVVPNQTLSHEALRNHLSTHLPDYMIPAVFVSLTELPLTPNGKVDFKALPQPAHDRTSEVAYAPPVTETEMAMEILWRQVLQVDRIGIHDDFFALGGHSLAVMRLISLCNSQFKASLALRSLFDNPTIAQLSRAIDTNSNSTLHPSLVSLRSTGNRTPLFCVHPAGGAVLRYVPLTNALNPDQPVYGLQARALLENEPLGVSMEEMAADYITAIQSIQPKGPYQLLGWSSGGMLCYEMAQQLGRAGETVSFLGLMDTSLPDYSKRNPSEKELMHAFAVTFGYEDLWKQPKKAKTREELQQRILAANRLPMGLDFPQFQRFYAVFCNTLSIYGHYMPKPWSGPFTLFRAVQRSSPMPDWSTLVGPQAVYIDLDCTHADLPSEAIAPTLAQHIENLLK